jgi:hypothetical protein
MMVAGRDHRRERMARIGVDTGAMLADIYEKPRAQTR